MLGIGKRKHELRGEMFARLASGEATKEMGDQAVAFIGASMAFRDAHSVMLYIPLQGEPDSRPLIDAALRDGKRVLLPRCYSNAVMKAHVIERGDKLKRSKYGILEPDMESPVVPPDQIDLILIPALAYDKQGFRLGRGGGFFDRYLAGCTVKKIGVCYVFQLMDELPKEKHDIRVDMLFTEIGGFVTGGG